MKNESILIFHVAKSTDFFEIYLKVLSATSSFDKFASF